MEPTTEPTQVVNVWQALALLIPVLSAIVGLVVWIVKWMVQKIVSRQDEITQQFLSHMKEQVADSKQVHERYASAIEKSAEKSAESTNKISEAVKVNTDTLKRLNQSVLKSQRAESAATRAIKKE